MGLCGGARVEMEHQPGTLLVRVAAAIRGSSQKALACSYFLAGQAAILAEKQAFLARQKMLGQLQRLSQAHGKARQSATFAVLEPGLQSHGKWQTETNSPFHPVQSEQ